MTLSMLWVKAAFEDAHVMVFEVEVMIEIRTKGRRN
jgi:hypothetical protein